MERGMSDKVIRIGDILSDLISETVISLQRTFLLIPSAKSIDDVVDIVKSKENKVHIGIALIVLGIGIFFLTMS